MKKVAPVKEKQNAFIEEVVKDEVAESPQNDKVPTWIESSQNEQEKSTKDENETNDQCSSTSSTSNMLMTDALPQNLQVAGYTVAQDDQTFTIVIDTKGILEETFVRTIDDNCVCTMK